MGLATDVCLMFERARAGAVVTRRRAREDGREGGREGGRRRRYVG